MNHFSDTPTDSGYYDEGGISAYEYIVAKDLNFALGNVIKYVSRAGKKNAATHLEDLKKARWYLQAEIDRVEIAIEDGEIEFADDDADEEQRFIHGDEVPLHVKEFLRRSMRDAG
jgi:hypothetical protein